MNSANAENHTPDNEDVVKSVQQSTQSVSSETNSSFDANERDEVESAHRISASDDKSSEGSTETTEDMNVDNDRVEANSSFDANERDEVESAHRIWASDDKSSEGSTETTEDMNVDNDRVEDLSVESDTEIDEAEDDSSSERSLSKDDAGDDVDLERAGRKDSSSSSSTDSLSSSSQVNCDESGAEDARESSAEAASGLDEGQRPEQESRRQRTKPRARTAAEVFGTESVESYSTEFITMREVLKCLKRLTPEAIANFTEPLANMLLRNESFVKMKAKFMSRDKEPIDSEEGNLFIECLKVATLKDPSSFQAFFSTLIEMRSCDPEFLTSVAAVKLQAGDLDAAEYCLRRALPFSQAEELYMPVLFQLKKYDELLLLCHNRLSKNAYDGPSLDYLALLHSKGLPLYSSSNDSYWTYEDMADNLAQRDLTRVRKILHDVRLKSTELPRENPDVAVVLDVNVSSFNDFLLSLMSISDRIESLSDVRSISLRADTDFLEARLSELSAHQDNQDVVLRESDSDSSSTSSESDSSDEELGFLNYKWKLPKPARKSLKQRYISTIDEFQLLLRIVKHVRAPILSEYIESLFVETMNSCPTYGILSAVQINFLRDIFRRVDLNMPGLKRLQYYLLAAEIGHVPNLAEWCAVLETEADSERRVRFLWALVNAKVLSLEEKITALHSVIESMSERNVQLIRTVTEVVRIDSVFLKLRRKSEAVAMRIIMHLRQRSAFRQIADLLRDTSPLTVERRFKEFYFEVCVETFAVEDDTARLAPAIVQSIRFLASMANLDKLREFAFDVLHYATERFSMFESKTICCALWSLLQRSELACCWPLWRALVQVAKNVAAAQSAQLMVPSHLVVLAEAHDVIAHNGQCGMEKFEFLRLYASELYNCYFAQELILKCSATVQVRVHGEAVKLAQCILGLLSSKDHLATSMAVADDAEILRSLLTFVTPIKLPDLEAKIPKDIVRLVTVLYPLSISAERKESALEIFESYSSLNDDDILEKWSCPKYVVKFLYTAVVAFYGSNKYQEATELAKILAATDLTMLDGNVSSKLYGLLMTTKVMQLAEESAATIKDEFPKLTAYFLIGKHQRSSTLAFDFACGAYQLAAITHRAKFAEHGAAPVQGLDWRRMLCVVSDALDVAFADCADCDALSSSRWFLHYLTAKLFAKQQTIEAEHRRPTDVPTRISHVIHHVLACVQLVLADEKELPKQYRQGKLLPDVAYFALSMVRKLLARRPSADDAAALQRILLIISRLREALMTNSSAPADLTPEMPEMAQDLAAQVHYLQRKLQFEVQCYSALYPTVKFIYRQAESFFERGLFKAAAKIILDFLKLKKKPFLSACVVPRNPHFGRNGSASFHIRRLLCLFVKCAAELRDVAMTLSMMHAILQMPAEDDSLILTDKAFLLHKMTAAVREQQRNETEASARCANNYIYAEFVKYFVNCEAKFDCHVVRGLSEKLIGILFECYPNMQLMSFINRRVDSTALVAMVTLMHPRVVDLSGFLSVGLQKKIKALQRLRSIKDLQDSDLEALKICDPDEEEPHASARNEQQRIQEILIIL